MVGLCKDPRLLNVRMVWIKISGLALALYGYSLVDEKSQEEIFVDLEATSDWWAEDNLHQYNEPASLAMEGKL